MTHVRFQLTHTEARQPAYATDGASGMDLHAVESVVVPARGRVSVPTGLRLASMPLDFEIQIRGRSGLAFRHGIAVINSPGTVDSDYRGEIGVMLVNHSDEDYQVEAGDRVAQAVLAPIARAAICVDAYNPDATPVLDTARGVGGFGSTGR